MSLLDLINNPNTFTLGVNNLGNTNLTYGNPSKSIKWGDRGGELPHSSFHLVDRVTFEGNKTTFTNYNISDILGNVPIINDLGISIAFLFSISNKTATI